MTFCRLLRCTTFITISFVTTGVLPLRPSSAQVIICGRQVMCSYLTQDIELRVVQHYVGPDSQTVVREHCDCLEAGAKLPSYVLEDAEMTELCVRARGDEDWSQDVQLERRNKGSSSSVVQVTATTDRFCADAVQLLTVGLGFVFNFFFLQEMFDKDKHTCL